jgi:hypothetical protein
VFLAEHEFCGRKQILAIRLVSFGVASARSDTPRSSLCLREIKRARRRGRDLLLAAAACKLMTAATGI